MELTQDEQLLHDLAFLYFAIGYGADCDLDESELETIKAKLSERYPDLEEYVVDRAASTALKNYLDAEDPLDEAANVAVLVRDRLPDLGRRLVYSDLERVAEADGKVLDGERELLSVLADGWDIEPDGEENC